MAVVWFLLGDEHDMRLRDVREVGDARCDGVFGVEEFGMPHGTRTTEPWIN